MNLILSYLFIAITISLMIFVIYRLQTNYVLHIWVDGRRLFAGEFETLEDTEKALAWEREKHGDISFTISTCKKRRYVKQIDGFEAAILSHKIFLSEIIETQKQITSYANISDQLAEASILTKKLVEDSKKYLNEIEN